MNIVIAPDSFKESLSAIQVAKSIARGFQLVLPHAEYHLVPMADGGEGTTETLVAALNGKWVNLQVNDPLGRLQPVRYGILPDGSAVMEMAEAAGLHLLQEDERDPMQASTYGVGQMIAHALDHGVQHIIMGIGGSVTNDGGMGMAQALGFRLLNAQGQAIGLGAAALAQLHSIDFAYCHLALATCRFTIACDVTNPLCGDQGASAVFGPQKGASPEMVKQLDHLLGHYADCLLQAGLRDCRNEPGSGAAGGLGFGLRMFCQAELKAGVDMVMQILNLQAIIAKADLVITGEGRMDQQTQYGKVPMGILQIANQYNVPVIAIAGSIGEGISKLNQLGFKAVFSCLSKPCTLREALDNAAENIEQTASQVAGLYQLVV